MKRLISRGALVFLLLSSAEVLGVGLFSTKRIVRRVVLDKTKYEVTCEDGTTEVAKANDIFNNSLCGGPDANEFEDPKMKLAWRMGPNRVHYRAASYSTCRAWFGKGFRVPSRLEMEQAIGRGIGDDAINAKFGYRLALEPRVWTDDKFPLSHGHHYSRGKDQVYVFDFTSGGAGSWIEVSWPSYDTREAGSLLCVKSF